MDALLSYLGQLVAQFNAYSKVYPALAVVAGAWVATTLTLLLRQTPAKLGRFLARQCTTTLTFTNDDRGMGHENFHAFNQWFMQRRGARLSRALFLDATWANGQGSSLGVGNNVNHYFFWRCRLFWLHRHLLDKGSSTHQLNYEITVTMLGRKRQLILDMIEDFRPKPDPTMLRVYVYNRGCWTSRRQTRYRNLDTVITHGELKEQLVEIIKFFKANQAWYERRGWPYKMTFALHGIPGTGKSSLIKAIASHFKMNLALINFSSMSDEMFADAMATVPDNCMVLIEDFDTVKATKKRKPRPSNTDITAPALAPQRVADAPTKKDETEEAQMLTLSGILNTLDGVASLDDQIVFLTTNHLEDIDPALIREGRVDHIFEVKALEQPEVIQYLQLVYPDWQPPANLPHFAPVPGCKLQAIYSRHRESVEAMIEEIPKAELVLVKTA